MGSKPAGYIALDINSHLSLSHPAAQILHPEPGLWT